VPGRAAADWEFDADVCWAPATEPGTRGWLVAIGAPAWPVARNEPRGQAESLAGQSVVGGNDVVADRISWHGAVVLYPVPVEC